MKQIIFILMAVGLIATAAWANNMLLLGVGGSGGGPTTFGAFVVTDNGGENFVVTDNGGEDFNVRE